MESYVMIHGYVPLSLLPSQIGGGGGKMQPLPSAFQRHNLFCLYKVKLMLSNVSRGLEDTREM